MRIHGIVGICLSMHLRQRFLLLWHTGEASRTPHCVPWNWLWQQKDIMQTQCLGHHNSHSDGWCTTVPDGMVVIVGTVTWDIMRSTPQRNTSTALASMTADKKVTDITLLVRALLLILHDYMHNLACLNNIQHENVKPVKESLQHLVFQTFTHLWLFNYIDQMRIAVPYQVWMKAKDFMHVWWTNWCTNVLIQIEMHEHTQWTFRQMCGILPEWTNRHMYQPFIYLQARYEWFMTKVIGAYIARRVIFSSL